MNYDMKESGLRIRQLRLQSKLTQEELAKQLDIDRSLLSHVEAGRRGCSVDLLVQLSTHFKVSLDYLVMGNVHSAALDQSREQMAEGIEVLIKHLEAFKATIEKM